jgi:peptidoglycan/LPS O-acetylase OafA/YrhL
MVFASHTSFAPQNSNFGIVGVSIFFVISGIVITGNLLQQLDESEGRIEINQFLWNFYVRRFRRLVPLSILIMLTVVFFEIFVLNSDKREYLLAALFIVLYIPNLFGVANIGYSDLPGSLGHYWSLGVEEQFYLLWPICFYLIFSKSTSKNLLRLISITAIFFLFLH